MSRVVRYSLVIACVAVIIAIYMQVYKTLSNHNVCPSKKNYTTLGQNSVCWFDPDVDSNATQIIANNGYKSEVHEVTSDDGNQILTLFRISNKNKNTNGKGPVFLMHGLTSSSISFLGLSKKSLPFLLSDAGYDVWLGNARGTIYSLKNKKYSATEDAEFWNHSFHEMAVHDIPAFLKYIRKINDKKIIYIGYSVGTAQGLIYSSTYPKEAKENLELFIFMSPVIKNNKDIKGFSYETMGPTLRKLNEMLPVGFLDLKFDPITGKYGCMQLPLLPMWIQIEILSPILRVTGLMDFATIQPESFPKIIRHNGHGASIKAMIHMFEYPNELRQFDYSSEENRKRYGQEVPPKYMLSDNQVPVTIYHSLGDEIASSEDALEFYNSLPKQLKKGAHQVTLKTFSHLDFIYGSNVKEEVYDRIVSNLIHVKKTNN